MSGDPGAADATRAGGVAGAAQPRVPRGFRPLGYALVISGPSGVGKTSLCRQLLADRDDVAFSVSATTRPQRKGEVHGQDYWFHDEAEFRRREAAGEFAETARVHGDLYGTPRAPLEAHVAAGRIVLLDVDVQGGQSLRRAFPEGVFIFVYPPSLEALRERLAGRGSDPPEVIERRLRQAPEEMAHYRDYDYVVVNDELARARAAIAAIVEAERNRLARLETR